MRAGGLVPAVGRPPTRWLGRPALLPQPALQGAFTGQGQLGLGLVQPDADVSGSPQRMLLSQGQDQVARGMGTGWPPWTRAVVSRQVVGPLAETLQEMADGPHGEGQVLGQAAGRPAALGQEE